MLNPSQSLKILGCWAVLACAPKEAADPHELLAEDYERAGHADDPAAPEQEHAPATRAECERAVSHVYALGGGDTNSADGETFIAERVDECIARGTSQREAQCIAKIASESEIDRCSAE